MGELIDQGDPTAACLRCYDNGHHLYEDRNPKNPQLVLESMDRYRAEDGWDEEEGGHQTP